MTTRQYRKAIEQLGLTIVGAGPVLGVTPRQAQRYAAGDPIPATIAKLIACYLAHGLPRDPR